MPTFRYTRAGSGATSVSYGVLLTIPAWMKKSGIVISGTMTGTVSSSAEGWTISGSLKLDRKLNGGTETNIKTNTKTGTQGQTFSQSTTFSWTVDLSSATKLGFKFTGSRTVSHTNGSIGPTSFNPTGSYSLTLNIQVPDFSTESKITADLVNLLADAFSVSTSADTDSAIVRAPYNALATAVGASSFNSSRPLATDLEALITAANGQTAFAKSWDSTSSSNY